MGEQGFAQNAMVKAVGEALTEQGRMANYEWRQSIASRRPEGAFRCAGMRTAVPAPWGNWHFLPSFWILATAPQLTKPQRWTALVRYRVAKIIQAAAKINPTITLRQAISAPLPTG